MKYSDPTLAKAYDIAEELGKVINKFVTFTFWSQYNHFSYEYGMHTIKLRITYNDMIKIDKLILIGELINSYNNRD